MSLENDIWKSGLASPTLPATGLPLGKVASAPAQGQYAVSPAGVYSFAAADANADLLEMMLAAGADVNARTDQGLTALMAAGLTDRWDLVERLKQAGATE